MAVLTHLRDDAGSLRLLQHLPRLADRMRHRLLDVHVDAAPNRQKRRQRMLVIGCGDHHRIQLFAHRVEQLSVVGEGFDLRSRSRRHLLADDVERLGDLAAVRIHDGHDPFLARLRQQHWKPPAVAAPDQRDA